MIYIGILVMCIAIAFLLTLLVIFFSLIYSKMIEEMEEHEDVRGRKSDM
ncbi:hypothetical protein [Turicibacter sanguinis]|nr:hypothetical protein [Turicibacter sanguinis]MDB8554087.1 hypothetical protein [Turicibacter sanguinis]